MSHNQRKTKSEARQYKNLRDTVRINVLKEFLRDAIERNIRKYQLSPKLIKSCLKFDKLKNFHDPIGKTAKFVSLLMLKKKEIYKQIVTDLFGQKQNREKHISEIVTHKYNKNSRLDQDKNKGGQQYKYGVNKSEQYLQNALTLSIQTIENARELFQYELHKSSQSQIQEVLNRFYSNDGKLRGAQKKSSQEMVRAICLAFSIPYTEPLSASLFSFSPQSSLSNTIQNSEIEQKKIGRLPSYPQPIQNGEQIQNNQLPQLSQFKIIADFVEPEQPLIKMNTMQYYENMQPKVTSILGFEIE